MRRAQVTFADAWRLVRPYWVSEERWKARSLLATVIGLDLFLTYVGVQQTYWQKNFFDALVERDLAGFWRQLGVLLFIVGGIVAAGTARVWFEQALEMRWRTWLTDVYLDRWLQEHAYFRIENARLTDNPDQRIAEDLRQMAGDTLRLSVGLLHYCVDFFTFATVIWGLSGALSFTLAGYGIRIPGYMLWAAVIYALVGSIVIEKVGRRLVGIDYQQQRCEADFRYLLVRVRENAEQIALGAGGSNESTRLKRAFDAVRTNWRRVMDYTKRVTVVNSTYVQTSMILPYLITGPRYFAGMLTVGDMMQLNSLFNRVRGALSWFVYRYKDLAMLRAVYRRLAEFERAIESHRASGIETVQGDGDALRVRALHVVTSDGRALGQVEALDILPGQRWLIHGPSGTGKSTFLGVLAGLWPHGSGRIERPRGKVMFVPQRGYLPVGTLRACLAYPQREDWPGTQDCLRVLQAVGLERLADELLLEDHWARRLSPGEQQRLAFARVLLHEPAFVFLDESTSALDLDAEARLYGLLAQCLPETAIVSVAHRPSLAAFHAYRLEWAPAQKA